MKSEQYLEISAQYGTPTYIFDLDVIAKRVEDIKEVLGGEISLCFAMKANPFLTGRIQGIDYYEVCSPGELTICERAGVNMQGIVFSGVNKTKEDILRALKNKVGLLTAESLKHVKLIDEAAFECGVNARVLLRLTSGNQFGMDLESIENIVKSKNTYKNIEFYGIHYFAGTQRKKTSEQLKELAFLETVFEKLEKEQSFKVQHLEYGPGLGVADFEGEDAAFEFDVLSAVASKLKEIAAKRAVMVEMGRFFAASCGSYLTKVEDTKENNGTSCAILDGGIHHISYSGQLMGMQTPVIEHVNPAGTQKKDWLLAGSLCTTSDVLARKAQLTGVEEGSVLVFKNAGAYAVTEGISLLLSRKLPGVLLYSKKSGITKMRSFFATDSLNYL